MKYDLINILLDIGTNINSIDFLGLSPLMHAFDSRTAMILIDRGIDIHKRASDGKTALHYAAIYLRYDVAKVLLDHGIDHTLQDSLGQTALHFCANELRLVQLFFSYKANFFIPDNKSVSPIDCVRNDEVKEFLISKNLLK